MDYERARPTRSGVSERRVLEFDVQDVATGNEGELL